MRAEAHINLSAYYLIPLVVLVIFWIFEGDLLLNQSKTGSMDLLKVVLNWKNLFAIIICIGMASSNIYYAFFSCFFLLVAGICATVSRKKWVPLLNSFILIGVIGLCIFALNIPTLIYYLENGMSSYLTEIRSPQQSEIYGLKIIQLLLPIQGHRIPLFGYIADRYASTAPLVNENAFSALGIIGSIGFIILLIWIFIRLFNKCSISHSETLIKLNQISALNLATVLLATIGGFGTIFAYLILQQLRCYNRLSIFIAFFSITAVMLLIDLLIKKYSYSKIIKWIIYGCITAILFFGIFDQTSATNANWVPNYKNTKEAFLLDERFINNIETKFPDDTMIFQLPYAAFIRPMEATPVKMQVYDHFRAYLHSKTIHWSYGAWTGRDGDLWQKDITNKPMKDMIKGLSLAGFNGIYVDSLGYKDNGKEVISAISSILNETPLVSDNKRLYFFDMTRYNLNLR
jgi:phosphoglycerol transferase